MKTYIVRRKFVRIGVPEVKDDWAGCFWWFVGLVAFGVIAHL